jgi:hypothetical protein
MKRILNNGGFVDVFVIILAIVITWAAVSWLFNRTSAGKVLKASITTETVSFEKNHPSFKTELGNSSLSQFVYTTHGTDYYVTVDLTAKTVNVKVTVGFFSKVNVDANLDLATGRIDFKGNATDNDAYGLLSKVHSTDMYSIFDDLFGVSVLYGSDIKFVKETDLYFVASGSNMPQFTFKDKKLVSITTANCEVTDIIY